MKLKSVVRNIWGVKSLLALVKRNEKSRDFYRMLKFLTNAEQKKEFKNRTQTLLDCPDNKKIDRVADAGKVRNGFLTMHNGLQVKALGYYGYPGKKMLIQNRGVHEPQEELAFGEVLASMPEKATMVELGSYWGFYSMWFHQAVKHATCYLIEPDPVCMETGKKNFIKNNMQGDFTAAFVARKSGKTQAGQAIVCLDDFVEQKNMESIDILHSDIQGAEYEMLKGAKKTFESQKVGYVFISSHSNKLHEACIAWLKNYDFGLVAEANLNESYSHDGVIVMKAPHYKGITEVSISKRRSTRKMEPAKMVAV